MTNHKFDIFLLAAVIILSLGLRNKNYSNNQNIDDEHIFISSIYKSLIDSSIRTYNLYYKPISIKFSDGLINQLRKYMSEKDLAYMREKANSDTSFIWQGKFLDNCNVLTDRKRNVRISFGNVVLLDSTGKRLDPKLYPKPAGHNEFYYDFSVPLFNRNKDFVYIQAIEYFGNRTRYLYYLFRKNGKVWEKLDAPIDCVEVYSVG